MSALTKSPSFITAPYDIALDTDSGTILLKDGGTNKGRITTSSDIISIVNSTQDGDIKFDGLDGSSSITALRLDMSEAGTATFNKDILLSDNSALRLGTSQDLALFHDGTDSFIRNNTGSHLIVAHSNSLRAIVKILDQLNEEEIVSVNIPTGVPLVYSFDSNFNIISKEYLIEDEELLKKQNFIKSQGKAN